MRHIPLGGRYSLGTSPLRCWACATPARPAEQTRVKNAVRSFIRLSSAGGHRSAPVGKAGVVPYRGQVVLDCQLLTGVTLSTAGPARGASSPRLAVSYHSDTSVLSRRGRARSAPILYPQSPKLIPVARAVCTTSWLGSTRFCSLSTSSIGSVT